MLTCNDNMYLKELDEWQPVTYLGFGVVYICGIRRYIFGIWGCLCGILENLFSILGYVLEIGEHSLGSWRFNGV